MQRKNLTAVRVFLILALAACDGNIEGSADLGPSTGGCPDQGGSMVRLPEGMCIDRTEVTREAYFAWLASEPAVSEQPAECASNESFEPTCQTEGAWGPDRNLEHPIGCVDWCDAAAFCQAHGKRLCGALGGGPLGADEYADAERSEWFAACSSGGEFDYVFGDDYLAHECYESPLEGWASLPVGERANCVSPRDDYAGVYDLGGNLAEWTHACDAEGADARCRIRGGSYKHSANGIRCDAGSTLLLPRTATDDAVGIRCCAD